MAITVANLTSDGSTTDGTSFSTASVTPGSNRLVLLTVDYTPASGTAAPTVTGNGLTWVEIAGGEYGGAGAGRIVRMFRAMGASPSAGAVTMDFGAVSQGSLNWSVDEANGVDTSGTNGSGAVVQSVTSLPSTNGLSLSLTLAALGSANNVAFGGFSHAAAETSTVGSGFTALANRSIGTPALSLLTEYQLNVTAVDASWATSTTRGAVAIEIKASAGAAPGSPANGLMLVGVGQENG